MEHGWCPTNSPGRTPIQIAGSFAVLLDFPGFLILDQPPECYGTWFESDHLPWSDTLEPTTKVLWNMGVSDQPTSSDTRARAQKVLENPIAETQGAEYENARLRGELAGSWGLLISNSQKNQKNASTQGSAG